MSLNLNFIVVLIMRLKMCRNQSWCGAGRQWERGPFQISGVTENYKWVYQETVAISNGMEIEKKSNLSVTSLL